MSRSIVTRLTVATLLILMLAAASIFFMGGRHTAYADSPGGGRVDPGAKVMQGFLCFIFLPPQIPFLLTTDSHEVQTPSGEANLTCHFTTAPPPQTVILTGWTCFTSYGIITDSRAVYSESGNITITCHYPGS